MIRFLIAIDKEGKIFEIRWSTPVYIVTKRNQSIFELFLDKDKEKITEMIAKSMMETDLFHCSDYVFLKSETIKMELFSLTIGEQILVLAVEEKLLDNYVFNVEVKKIFGKLMYTIKQDIKDIRFHNIESTHFQFEEIQRINNELINTKRELERANAKLNILNSDLNNRLVKDALTGLVSRYQYRAEIEYVISQNPGALGIFTFIDIDNFKSINDNYGHSVGDKYLIEFSERLKKMPMENTIKLRIAGDEIGLFSYGYHSVNTSSIKEVWEQINNYVLAKPIQIEGRIIPISISAGMAVYGIDTFDIYQLIEYADFAMYRAKKDGKNGFHIFDKVEYESINGIPKIEQ